MVTYDEDFCDEFRGHNCPAEIYYEMFTGACELETIFFYSEKGKKMQTKKKVMFISSTGGHFSELMQLKPMFEKYDYHIVTEKDEVTKGFKEQYGKKMHFMIYGTRAHIISYIFKFLANCFITLFLFIKIRPKYIITTGTHNAGPMCILGHIFKRKIIYIETFANRYTKTATGKRVYKFADLFIVQWEELLKEYPKAKYGGSIY